VELEEGAANAASTLFIAESTAFVGDNSTGAIQKGRSNDVLVGAVGSVSLVDAGGMSGIKLGVVVTLTSVSFSKDSLNGSAARTGDGVTAIPGGTAMGAVVRSKGGILSTAFGCVVLLGSGAVSVVVVVLSGAMRNSGNASGTAASTTLPVTLPTSM
jgi:hypothetical protein